MDKEEFIETEEKEEEKEEENEIEVDCEENMQEDKLLYKKFINGDKESFNKLIEKYRLPIICFLESILRDFHAAEDVSQEAFVYLLQHKDIYDFRYSLKTYLYLIAKSRALNYIKSRKRITFIEDQPEWIVSKIAKVEDVAEIHATRDEIYSAINKMKLEYKMAIYLVDINQMSYKETAMILGKTMVQTKVLIHNARKKLKTLIEKEKKDEA